MARRAAQADSDIEDDDASQPTQHAKRPKKEKVSKKRGVNGTSDRHVNGVGEGASQAGGAGNEEDDDDGRIDVDHFYNQPLTNGELPKLGGLAKDWSQMEKQITGHTGFIGDIGAATADLVTAQEEGSGQVLETLDTIMRDIVDLAAEMKANEHILDNIYQELAQGKEIDNAVSRYTNAIEKLTDQYNTKTTRQKYAKDPSYLRFKQAIWDVDHPEQPMPPLTELLPKEDGDVSDDDDDIEVGGVTQDYKCPLSLMPLQDPWTSEVCGHSFSGEAIQDFFKGARVPKKCPAAGCTRTFMLSQCKPDANLAKKVRAILRRQQRREEEDSDVDEVVD